ELGRACRDRQRLLEGGVLGLAGAAEPAPPDAAIGTGGAAAGAAGPRRADDRQRGARRLGPGAARTRLEAAAGQVVRAALRQRGDEEQEQSWDHVALFDAARGVSAALGC